MIEADFETRSDIDIRIHGANVYFESPRARVLLGSFKIGAEKFRWRFGQPCPERLAETIESGGMIAAHNASFEALCFDWLADNCGWPRPKLEQFRCTAATAAAMSLPRSLDKLGAALNLAVQKDKDGMRLIRKFSIPKNGVFTEPEADPVDFENFHAYCDLDVETEAQADARMVPLSDHEQAVYTLSERINRRGIRIDIESARAALHLAEKAKAAMDVEMRRVTGGAVRKCSEVARLTEWVQAQGVALDSMGKQEISEALAYPDVPSHVREALEIRQEAAKTSVSKLQSMIDRASRDGRVRGTFLYHGASTGRWASMGVNFTNMPRPRRIYDDAHIRQDVLFQAIRAGDPDYLRFLYGDDLGRPLHLVSDAIRGFIMAAPGHDLIQADYLGIEGAVVAWLAREEWKLAEMAAIIADPSRPDLYRQTAASILGLPIADVTKKHWARQAVGKPAELGLGYQGGVSAFWTFARNYGVDLEAIAAPMLERAAPEALEKAAKRFEACFKRNQSKARDLSRDAWMACEIIKVGWRAQNAAIAKSWHDLEATVREAVENPGQVSEAARVQYIVRFGFLWARLPSGRCLAYGAPRLVEQVWARVKLEDGTWSDAEVMDRVTAERGVVKGTVQIDGNTSDKVTVMGVDAVTKQWRRYGLYGGLLQENNTQAVARDLLVNGMERAEAKGYPIIAHVYDEIIAEVPKGFGDLADFEREICILPDWAAGLPLTAGGWRGKRYRKE